MADTVQYHLERMLPELDDLEKRGLFKRWEIKEIVKRRRDFEYLLKRHSTLKQDYVRYIEYETKLEALRGLRKKGLVRDLKGTGEKWKPSLCDRASSMHIMLIYERALRRYKGDLNLWLQYLEYCKSQAPKKMQRVAAKCLQLHPTVPGLWMYAAAWEFNHQLNMIAARALMQRGLRICPHAENLWLEYFRMELTYIQKLKGRRLALGLEPLTSSKGNKASRQGPSQSQPDSLTEADEKETAEAVNSTGEDSKVLLEDNLSYRLAQSVYNNAIAAVPSSLGFRQHFLEALDAFEFDKRQELEAQIEASIINDFPADESSWDWLARRHFESDRRAILVFEDALQAIPSARMYELHAKFLTDSLDAETLGINSVDKLNNNRHNVAGTICQLYERALAAGISSEPLAKGHLEFLQRIGRLGEALDLSRKFCGMKQLKNSARLWEWRISLEIESLSAVTDDQDRREIVLKLFQEAVKCVPLTEAKQLWLMVLDFYNGLESYVRIVIEMLEKALAGGSGGLVAADLACVCLSWILGTHGMKEARQTYLRFLALPGPSVELFNLCITIEAQIFKLCSTIEAQHDSISRAQSFQYLRKLFNDAVELFGQHDTDLWIEYHRTELMGGNVDQANNIYWRAKKTLKDPTSFMEKHLPAL